MSHSKEWAKMCAGEPYEAWDKDLQANRVRCYNACKAFNALGMGNTRREKVVAWRAIIDDERPLPPVNPDPEQDAAQFELTDPVVEGPISVDHGQNFIVEPGAFLNFGLVVLDTCPVKVGARTLFGPDIRIYTALHPLEPAARNGLKGPEFGKPVTIGQDCWIGGSAIILAGVTIGNGSTIGAGSVVTRDIPQHSLAVGNPARVIRTLAPGEKGEVLSEA